MKNKSIFVYVTLVTLLLTSCWNKTETNTETNQVLDEINQEVEKIDNITTTWDEQSSINSEAKVLKLEKKYTSPGWEDQVEFNITMNWNVIENVEANLLIWWDISKKRTEAFNNEIMSIKWKTIEEVQNMTVIWWSSLTTQAFKDALKEIN